MKAQARALLEAAAGRTLNVMFPMVSEALGVRRGTRAVRGAAHLGRGRGRRLPTEIRYGAMLEVPALAEQLDVLLPSWISCRSAPTT